MCVQVQLKVDATLTWSSAMNKQINTTYILKWDLIWSQSWDSSLGLPGKEPPLCDFRVRSPRSAIGSLPRRYVRGLGPTFRKLSKINRQQNHFWKKTDSVKPNFKKFARWRFQKLFAKIVILWETFKDLFLTSHMNFCK